MLSATDVVLRISEIPVNPVTMGVYDSINNYYVYEICEGEDIPDFVIDTPPSIHNLLEA